jgi:serine/threonine protein kinase
MENPDGGDCLACGTPHVPGEQLCTYRPPAWLSDDRVVAEYDVTRCLGHGGMGETFLARHRHLGANRVLKGILPDRASTTFRERFLQEARAASQVQHRNVATLHDFFLSGDGSPVAVWEYIDGETSAQELAVYGPYELLPAIDLTLQTLDGLSAIHRTMTHRDIKPANIMIDRRSGSPVVKIIDFGLARTFNNTDQSSYILGSCNYMPPEAFDLADRERWAATVDLFAVGAVFFEFLVGLPAFPGDVVRVAAKLADGSDPEWQGVLAGDSQYSLSLTAVIRRALAREPRARYQTAAAFREALLAARSDFEATANRLTVKNFGLPCASAASRLVVAPMRMPRDATDAFLCAYLEDLVKLRSGLETVYIPLAASTRANAKIDPWSDPALGAPVFEASERDSAAAAEVHLEDITEAVDLHTQFYVIGESGAGKTLTLMAIEIVTARRYLAGTYLRFPLRIDLSSWSAETQSFDVFLERELDGRTGVKSQPPARLLLMIDGVIDSLASSRERLKVLEDWLRRHPLCAAVLAVRTEGVFTRELPSVRIESLNASRIRALVTQSLGAHEGGVFLRQIGFGGGVDEEPDIAPLLRNPFNLSLICGLRSRERLPQTRPLLMRKVLMARHDRERRSLPEMPDWDSLVDVLGAAALHTIRSRLNLSADKAKLRKHESPPDDIQNVLALATNCGIVKARDNDRFEFEHRLYLEYFTAEYLGLHHDQIENVLQEPRYEDGQRIPGRFDEVIQSLVQLVSNLEVMRTIVAHDPLLAASCWPLQSGDDEYRSAAESIVVGGLVGLMSDSIARDGAIATLASFGIMAVTALRRLLSDARPFVRRGAVRALAQIRHKESMDAVLRALDDSNRWVREEARSAIRRFDGTSRELFLHSIRQAIEEVPAQERGRITTVVRHLVEDVATDFRTAITEAAGIPAAEDGSTAQAGADVFTESRADTIGVAELESVVDELFDRADQESERADESFQVDKSSSSSSWGFRWIEDYRADTSNAEKSSAGRSWLRVTSLRDIAWAHVWTELWSANPADADLEWLGRDWLTRVPSTARSWSYVWRGLIRANPGNAALASRGLSWLREVSANQIGWNHVWLDLWNAEWYRADLSKLGWWWLEEADADHESWSMVWLALLDAHENPARLDSIGRDWTRNTSPANRSWGFVWPRLWLASPGDQALDHVGRDWLEKAPAEHTGWAYIWPLLWRHAPRDPRLVAVALNWLKEAPPAHGGWGHIWPALWDSQEDHSELQDLGRLWLTSVAASHRGWSQVWTRLWKKHADDPYLSARAREWLLKAPHHEGWAFVAQEYLPYAADDTELLTFALRALPTLPNSSWGGSVWRALWDLGTQHDTLAPMGWEWLVGAGFRDGGFSFVWERLWKWQPTSELRKVGIDWLRGHASDKKWNFVAGPLAKSDPQDAELLQLAHQIIDSGPGARNLRYASQLVANRAGGVEYRDKAMAVRMNVKRFLAEGVEQWEGVEHYLQGVIRTSEQNGDEILHGIALLELGGVFRRQERRDGHLALANTTLLHALDIFNRQSPPRPDGQAAALHKLGDVCHIERRWIECEDAYRTAMEFRRSLSDVIAYAISLESLAKMHIDAGFVEAAQAELREALEIFNHQRVESLIAECNLLFGWLEKGAMTGDRPIVMPSLIESR